MQPAYCIWDAEKLLEAAFLVNELLLNPVETPDWRNSSECPFRAAHLRGDTKWLKTAAQLINNELHGQLDLLRGPDAYTEVRLQGPIGHVARHNTVYGPKTEMFKCG